MTVAVDSLARRLRILEAGSDLKEESCADPSAGRQRRLSTRSAPATMGVNEEPPTPCSASLPDQAALGVAGTATSPSLPASPAFLTPPVSLPGHRTNTMQRKPQDFDGSVSLEAGGGDASREVTPCLSASLPPDDGPLQLLTPPPSPCPHAAVSSSRDEKRKLPEFAGKVAFEAFLHQMVMVKFKSGDEREKQAGKQRVNGGCVALSLPTTHRPNHNSLYSLRPLSSPRHHLVSSSSWTSAGWPRLNWFSGPCQSRHERGRHRHGSRHATGRRTCSLHHLRSCPFDPGSSSGGQDGHFVGCCPSATLGQTGDTHEWGESDMRQSTLLQRQAA